MDTGTKRRPFFFSSELWSRSPLPPMMGPSFFIPSWVVDSFPFVANGSHSLFFWYMSGSLKPQTWTKNALICIYICVCVCLCKEEITCGRTWRWMGACNEYICVYIHLGTVVWRRSSVLQSLVDGGLSLVLPLPQPQCSPRIASSAPGTVPAAGFRGSIGDHGRAAMLVSVIGAVFSITVDQEIDYVRGPATLRASWIDRCCTARGREIFTAQGTRSRDHLCLSDGRRLREEGWWRGEERRGGAAMTSGITVGFFLVRYSFI